MIDELFPDETGVVRTVSLKMQSRRRRGKGMTVEFCRMAVQRLVVLLPVEERWEAGVAL